MDENISDLVRVRSWDEYEGQQTLKSHLDIKIRAALLSERLMDHTLLIGPPGAGKSTLVSLIGERLCDHVLVIPMPIAYDEFVYQVENFVGGIIFLDEIHNAKPAFQERLQFALQDGYLPGAYNERISTRHVTFIGATTTTEAKQLLKPLVDRFKYRPAWDPYSPEEMANIVAGMARRAGTPLDPEICAGLAGAAQGNPRIVQDLVAAARDLVTVGADLTVDAVLDLAGRDRDGLMRDHLDYLRALHALGGRGGLSTLASMTGMNPKVIEDLERPLVMRGFVKRTGAGRKLMPAGTAKIDQANGTGPTDVVSRRRMSA